MNNLGIVYRMFSLLVIFVHYCLCFEYTLDFQVYNEKDNFSESWLTWGQLLCACALGYTYIRFFKCRKCNSRNAKIDF